MFWIQREGIQKVGVPTEEKRKKGGSGTTMRSMGESEGV